MFANGRMAYWKWTAVVLATVGVLVPAAAVQSREAPPTPTVDENKRVLVRVPSRAAGRLEVVGVEISPGEDVPADRRVTVRVPTLLVRFYGGDKLKPGPPVVRAENESGWRPWQEGEPLAANDLVVYKLEKEYRRLQIGDRVLAGQVVAVVEAKSAVNDLNGRIGQLRADELAARVARKDREDAERRVSAMEEGVKRLGGVSKDDYIGAKHTAKRYLEEEAAKKSAVTKTQQELIQARTILDLHQVRVPVSGVVRSINRKAGDTVQALDSVLTVEAPRKPARKTDGAKSE